MAAAPGTRPPALHPDRRRARWEGQTEVAVDLSGVGRFPKAFGAKLAHQPGSTGWAGAPGDLPGLPPSRQSHLGWQPSRFLTDRAEAERAFQLAEQLGSVNAAAVELGTTWPSLREAFTRHGLGMPARNREAVRQRMGQPATPSLDPVFVALNHSELPVRARSGGELAERVRRAEDYAVLGARVVVELHSESHAAKPSTRVWAITRRAQRRHQDREQRGKRHRAGRVGRIRRPSPSGGWLPMPDDA